jgi:hypothetical protein
VSGVRLRQVALVAAELKPVVAAARRELELEEDPFADPGISVFGLHNAVMGVGDTFLEVVSPVQDGTTAGRYLERRGGDGGYMAIFQVEDLAAARARIDALGIRVVWRSDQPDIAGTHLHPKDVRGALVSIDWASPPQSWRWAGPSWTGGAPAHRGGGITAVTVQTVQPRELAARWGAVLGRESLEAEGGAAIALDGGEVRFVPERDGRGEGICEIEVVVPGARERRCALGGIDVVIRPTGG